MAFSDNLHLIIVFVTKARTVLMNLSKHYETALFEKLEYLHMYFV